MLDGTTALRGRSGNRSESNSDFLRMRTRHSVPTDDLMKVVVLNPFDVKETSVLSVLSVPSRGFLRFVTWTLKPGLLGSSSPTV